MKIIFKDGSVCAIAQSLEDITTLTSLARTPIRKHKRHQHTKVCDLCGRKCKGLNGLGIHKAKCRKDILTHQATNIN